MSDGTGVWRPSVSSSGASGAVALASEMMAGVDLVEDGVDVPGAAGRGGAERLGVLLWRGRPHRVPIHEELALLVASLGTSPAPGTEEEEALMV
jgi:hypothetical protein